MLNFPLRNKAKRFQRSQFVDHTSTRIICSQREKHEFTQIFCRMLLNGCSYHDYKKLTTYTYKSILNYVISGWDIRFFDKYPPAHMERETLAPPSNVTKVLEHVVESFTKSFAPPENGYHDVGKAIARFIIDNNLVETYRTISQEKEELEELDTLLRIAKKYQLDTPNMERVVDVVRVNLTMRKHHEFPPPPSE